ncbi:hypothetical protein DFJ77DRAFT_472763 [Powellomyces hirtus]|nr:hypothetical protein DFJ77DRAFT_472763 [Powellomyces hirtus]
MRSVPTTVGFAAGTALAVLTALYFRRRRQVLDEHVCDDGLTVLHTASIEPEEGQLEALGVAKGNVKTWSLTALDTTLYPQTVLSISMFFAKTVDHVMLERGLRDTLRYFPILQGRLRTTGQRENERLIVELDETPNTSGATFSAAISTVRLSDVVPDVSKLDKSSSVRVWPHSRHTWLFGTGGPAQLSDYLNKPTSILNVRVTHFVGGGTCVGLSLPHAVVDVASMGRFVDVWGCMCRGVDAREKLAGLQFTDQNVLQAIANLEPEDPDGAERRGPVAFMRRGVGNILKFLLMMVWTKIIFGVSTRVVHFPLASLNDLGVSQKSKTKTNRNNTNSANMAVPPLPPPQGDNPSGTERVVPYLWKLISHAKKQSLPTHLYLTANLRPLVPRSILGYGFYFGNLATFITSQPLVPRTTPLAAVTATLQRTIHTFPEHQMMTDMDWLLKHAALHHNHQTNSDANPAAAAATSAAVAAGGVLTVSGNAYGTHSDLYVLDWRLDFPYTACDFGKGHPVWISQEHSPAMPSSLVLFPGNNKGAGICAYLTLDNWTWWRLLRGGI